MSKDQWIKARENFEYQHGREPTDEEMHNAYVDSVSSLLDRADDLRKRLREEQNDS